MSTAIDQVLDLIGNMTVLELSELKTKFEDKFGVTAAAPMMAMPMGGMGGGAAAPAEEKTEFTVVLAGAGDKKIQVIKHTLLRRAFNDRGITELDAYLVGNTGLVYSPDSEMAPAKILSDFAKENDKLKVKAAVVDGRLFDSKSIGVLATLPSREILLSQVLSTFIAPMTQFLAAVNAALATPANMADALHREKSKAS